MNTLMVKEFDMGMSAEAWVLVDMYRPSHVGEDATDNTEEAGVVIATSIINRLLELSMPTGLAANAEQAYVVRPDSSPSQLGRLMEPLAAMRATGNVTLERFIYDLRPHLTRFNSLTVITPSRHSEWIQPLQRLRRQGVNLSVVYIDPESYGGSANVQSPVELLFASEIPTYVVKKGQPLNEALLAPLSGQFAAPNQKGGSYATGSYATEEEAL
jgi:uncharacterized protein (DUF58 family)